MAAAPDGGQGASARALLRTLAPEPVRVRLRPDELFDIDTPAQLAAWRSRTSAAVEAVLDRDAGLGRAVGDERPVVVRLLGSRSRTATLAAALRLRPEATGLVVLEEHGPAPEESVGAPDLVLGPDEIGDVGGA